MSSLKPTLCIAFGLFGLALGAQSPAGCFSRGQCLGGGVLGAGARSPSLAYCINLCKTTQDCVSVTYFTGTVIEFHLRGQ